MQHVLLRPEGHLQILSYQEAQQLCDASDQGLNDLLKQCTLAVLNTGSTSDDGLSLMDRFKDYDIQVYVQGRGVKVQLTHPPVNAFVDGELMRGLKEQIFAVVRDLLYTKNTLLDNRLVDLSSPQGITNAVFHQLRNADLLQAETYPSIVVCWGGHAISRHEYNYCKEVGYEMGLRSLNICTGCGPGAMKAPMKGAAVGHAKQRLKDPRYIGITEPGIIAAEAPNPVVNELVIMPDIEKRLEAFVRLGHAIVIFPGGAGTMEELLYLLAIYHDPDNAQVALPFLLTGPEGSEPYFAAIREFIAQTLGEKTAALLTIIINDAQTVAQHMKLAMEKVRLNRKETADAYYFNWALSIDAGLQQPFEPTHDNMAALNLSQNQPLHALAAELRRAFSGIVAGNVKRTGIAAIREKGPFVLRGDPAIMRAMDKLLKTFAHQRRMKFKAEDYRPCYVLKD